MAGIFLEDMDCCKQHLRYLRCLALKALWINIFQHASPRRLAFQYFLPQTKVHQQGNLPWKQSICNIGFFRWKHRRHAQLAPLRQEELQKAEEELLGLPSWISNMSVKTKWSDGFVLLVPSRFFFFYGGMLKHIFQKANCWQLTTKVFSRGVSFVTSGWCSVFVSFFHGFSNTFSCARFVFGSWAGRCWKERQHETSNLGSEPVPAVRFHGCTFLPRSRLFGAFDLTIPQVGRRDAILGNAFTIFHLWYGGVYSSSVCLIVSLAVLSLLCFLVALMFAQGAQEIALRNLHPRTVCNERCSRNVWRNVPKRYLQETSWRNVFKHWVQETSRRFVRQKLFQETCPTASSWRKHLPKGIRNKTRASYRTSSCQILHDIIHTTHRSVCVFAFAACLLPRTVTPVVQDLSAEEQNRQDQFSNLAEKLCLHWFLDLNFWATNTVDGRNLANQLR